MAMQTNKQIVQALVEAINTQDWNKLDALLAPDFKRHSYAAGPSQVNSRDALKQFLRQEFDTFSDATERIEDLVAEGDKVAVRLRFQGTQQGPLGPYPATGRVMECAYLAIYRVEAGQIVEAWAE